MNRCRTEHGQALLELAIFGGIALAALGFLIRVGMKMNYDQEIRMGAFRRALATARADNGTMQDAMAVGYHYILDRQMPDPADGFMSLPRQRTEASAFVEWGDRLTFAYETGNLDAEEGRKTQPLIVVRHNSAEPRRYRLDDFQGDEANLQQSRSVVSETSLTNTKRGEIVQTKAGSAVSTTTVTESLTTVNAVRDPETIISAVTSSIDCPDGLATCDMEGPED